MSLKTLFYGLAAAVTLTQPVKGCDLALVLAMDVSGSVNASEYELQVLGIANALRDPAVADALLHGRVALAVVQWSGALEQAVTVPWMRMDEPAQINRVATRIATMPRVFAGGNTAIGEAIDISTDQFSQVRDCAHWVIDVSGDGDENEGYTASTARHSAWSRGIVINGLAIERTETGQEISDYYRQVVATPGGFVITAQQHGDFARAIRVKLLRELRPPMAHHPLRNAERTGAQLAWLP